LKVLVFDLESDYAHFRKFYTTSSPLTFPFPPRTALQGIVGAILGYSKDEYMEKLRNTYLSISLNKPVKKMRIPLNLVNTKDAPAVGIDKLRAYFLGLRKGKFHEPHTQIRLEVLKDVSYRVYLFHPDCEVMGVLFEFFKTQKCIYTPYLGIASFISDTRLVGEYEALIVRENEEPVEISSPIKLEESLPKGFLTFEEGKVYFRERMPIQLKNDRTPEAYGTYLFEPNGKSIKVKIREYIKIEEMGNIIWM